MIMSLWIRLLKHKENRYNRTVTNRYPKQNTLTSFSNLLRYQRLVRTRFLLTCEPECLSWRRQRHFVEQIIQVALYRQLAWYSPNTHSIQLPQIHLERLEYGLRCHKAKTLGNIELIHSSGEIVVLIEMELYPSVFQILALKSFKAVEDFEVGGEFIVSEYSAIHTRAIFFRDAKRVYVLLRWVFQVFLES